MLMTALFHVMFPDRRTPDAMRRSNACALLFPDRYRHWLIADNDHLRFYASQEQCYRLVFTSGISPYEPTGRATAGSVILVRIHDRRSAVFGVTGRAVTQPVLPVATGSRS